MRDCMGRLLGLFLFFSALSPGRAGADIFMMGFVKDANGHPLDDAELYYESSGRLLLHLRTDPQGWFSSSRISDSLTGEKLIRVAKKNGFRERSDTLVLGAGVNASNVELKAEDGGGIVPSGFPSGSGDAMRKYILVRDAISKKLIKDADVDVFYKDRRLAKGASQENGVFDFPTEKGMKMVLAKVTSRGYQHDVMEFRADAPATLEVIELLPANGAWTSFTYPEIFAQTGRIGGNIRIYLKNREFSRVVAKYSGTRYGGVAESYEGERFGSIWLLTIPDPGDFMPGLLTITMTRTLNRFDSSTIKEATAFTMRLLEKSLADGSGSAGFNTGFSQGINRYLNPAMARFYLGGKERRLLGKGIIPNAVKGAILNKLSIDASELDLEDKGDGNNWLLKSRRGSYRLVAETDSCYLIPVNSYYDERNSWSGTFENEIILDTLTGLISRYNAKYDSRELLELRIRMQIERAFIDMEGSVVAIRKKLSHLVLGLDVFSIGIPYTLAWSQIDVALTWAGIIGWRPCPPYADERRFLSGSTVFAGGGFYVPFAQSYSDPGVDRGESKLNLESSLMLETGAAWHISRLHLLTLSGVWLPQLDDRIFIKGSVAISFDFFLR
jgi:hypothetical protein